MDNSQNHYLFTSERLGFRNWKASDLPLLIELNASPEVMRHFPKTFTKEETEGYFSRLQKHFEERRSSHHRVRSALYNPYTSGAVCRRGVKDSRKVQKSYIKHKTCI